MFLIVDACVLIDICEADRSVLTLVSRCVGDVHVATPVLAEVDQLDESEAISLGIKLVEPSLEMTAEAAATRGRLSFADRLCFLIAKERAWTCVSNDRRLRRTCEESAVSVLWGLELVGLLVDKGAMPPEGARDIGERICAANQFIGDAVLERFLARIGISRRDK